MRNATPRHHDIEFAADIGQGLLEEVRKLQGLLAQRDHKVNEMNGNVALLTRQLELYERQNKQIQSDHGIHTFQICR
jgi:hypothetical protein